MRNPCLLAPLKDFHLRRPENRSLGWRYVLEASEDWVKNSEEWPANIKKRQKAEQAKKDQEEKSRSLPEGAEKLQEPQQEHEWKRDQGEHKHLDAYAGNEHIPNGGSNGNKKSEYDKLLEKYSPQEIALLRVLQHEKDYIRNLKQNDGQQKSPQTKNRTQISIGKIRWS